MTGPVIRALTGSTEAPELTFRRRYSTTVDELRDACTHPDRLARWYGVVSGDPSEVGDAYAVRLGDEPSDSAEGEVLACSEDGFEISWRWQDERPSVVSVRFEPEGDSAWLTVQHRLAEAQHAVGYGGGWEQLLHALGRELGDAEPGARSDDEVEAAAVDHWRLMARHPLELEQHFAAPVAVVWEAFTTGLERWWWRHWSDTTIEADVRPGGRCRFEAPSAAAAATGTYLTVDEPHRLAHTWRWSDSDGEGPADEAVDVRFEEASGGTRVSVRHTGPWADEGPANDYRSGWQFTLGQLAEVLAEGRP